MSDVITPEPAQPVVPAVVPEAAAPVADPPIAAPKPSRASEALRAIEAARDVARAKRAAAKAPAAAQPVVDPDALAWRAHVKSESARIAAAAADLDDDDRALIAGEPDIGRKAALLARLRREAAPSKPAKTVAPARPVGGPPSSSAVDFAATLKDPKAMADAKARDPAGFEKFFSGLFKGGSRKSTLG